MGLKTQKNLNKLIKDCESTCDIASEEAIKVISKTKTLKGRRLDRMGKLLDKLEIDSVVALETLLLGNRKFAREVIEA